MEKTKEKHQERNAFRQVMKQFIDFNDEMYTITNDVVDLTDDTSVESFVKKITKDPACAALLSLLQNNSLKILRLFDAFRQGQRAFDIAQSAVGASPRQQPLVHQQSQQQLRHQTPTQQQQQQTQPQPQPQLLIRPSRTSVVVIDDSPMTPSNITNNNNINNNNNNNINNNNNDATDNSIRRADSETDENNTGVVSGCGENLRKRRKLTLESLYTFSIGELITYADRLLSQAKSERDKNMAKQMLSTAIQRSESEEIDGSSALQVAYVLHDGTQGVKKDLARAAYLYEKVLEGKWNGSAARNLARILMDGANGSVKADFKRSVNLFEQVIKRGDNNSIKGLAMSDLGLLYVFGADGVAPNMKCALRLWETASTSAYNNAAAMTNLANVMCTGVGHVKKDVHKAIALYEHAIDVDNVGEAMCHLAIILQHGIVGVVEANVNRAVKLHERAISEETHIQSMIELGMLLTVGKNGVKKDCERAAALFETAARKSWKQGRRMREFLTCGSSLADFRDR